MKSGQSGEVQVSGTLGCDEVEQPQITAKSWNKNGWGNPRKVKNEDRCQTIQKTVGNNDTMQLNNGPHALGFAWLCNGVCVRGKQE